jgi:SMP-30/Gluconolactonase/LRE-like region
VFHSNVPDSDDFTFDNDGYFLVRSGRDIARLAYGGMPEMVVRNVVGDRNTIDSLRVLSGGDIVIADYTSDELVRLDPTGGRRKLASLKSPNKLAQGPGGKLYVVGIEGDIYVVDPDNGMNNLLSRVDGRLRGLSFSVDYKTLYASDGRNNLLYSLALRPDGTAEAPRVLARNLGGGPDGMATDACGNIYIADHNASTIKRVTPKGVVETVANLDRTTSSIGFGSGKQGWDAKTLYTVSVERGGSYEIKIGLPAAPPPP